MEKSKMAVADNLKKRIDESQQANQESEIIGRDQSDAVREKLSWIDERDRLETLRRAF